MNKDIQQSSTIRNQWFTLAGISAAGMALLTAVLAWVRLNRQPVAVAPPLPEPTRPASAPETASSGPPVVAEPAPTPRRLSARQQVGLLALFGLGAAAFIGLQMIAPQLAAGMFVLVVLSPVGWVLWRQRGAARQLVGGLQLFFSPVRWLARHLRAWMLAHARLASAILGLSGLGLLALSTWYFVQTRGDDTALTSSGAAFYLLAGVAVLVGALAVQRAGQTPADAGTIPQTGVRINWSITGVGIVVLALLIESNVNILNLEALQPVSHHVQFALLVLGLALVTWGLSGGWRGARVALPATEAEPGRFWRRQLPLLAILALAFAVRYVGLGTSVHYLVDEMNTIPEVGAFWWPLHPVKMLTQMNAISPFPWVFAYWQWAGTLVLGNTLEGMRLASVVTGTLTVLALYWLARSLFDRNTALVAALLLATFPPHVHFSRLALLNIADPLFGTLALAFLGRALTRQRQLDYALAGVFLGLTQYFYNGGRMFYIPLAVAWVGALAISRYFQARREQSPVAAARGALNWRSLGIMLLALLVAAAPVYLTLLATGSPMVGRMEASGLGPDYWKDLVRDGQYDDYLFRLGWAFRFYVQNSDDSIYYSGTTPLVLPLLIPAFLAGIAVCLYHWRKPGGMLLPIWVVATAVGNSILIMVAASTRFVIAYPVLPLLMAVGLRYGLPLLWPPPLVPLALRLSIGRRRLRWRWPPRDVVGHLKRLALVLGLAAAGFQLYYYFGPHLEFYNRELRLFHAFPDGYDAMFRSTAFPDGTSIHLISANPFSQMDAQALLSYLQPDRVLTVNTLMTADFDETYLAGLPCGMDHAFFVQPNDWQTLALIKKYFYLREPEYSPDRDIIPDEREFVLYYSPYLEGLDNVYPRCSPSTSSD